MKIQTKISVIFMLFYTITINAQITDIEQDLDLASDSVFCPYLLGIVVSDVEKSAEWYEDNFGFEIIRRMNFPEYDSLQIIHMRMGKVELELIQKQTSFSIKKFVPNYNGFDKSPLRGISKIAFWVSDAETLANQIKKRNVKFLVNLYVNKEFAIKSFIIEDLDGNVLQFNQRL